jgi:hypothetical protein
MGSGTSAGLPEPINCTGRCRRRAINLLLTFTRVGPSISDSLDTDRPGQQHTPPVCQVAGTTSQRLR